jgi:hypothetical protein
MPFFVQEPMQDELSRVPCRRCWDLDYADVARGVIRCAVCVRTWRLEQRVDRDDVSKGWGRWQVSPCPGCVSGGWCEHRRQRRVRERRDGAA